MIGTGEGQAGPRWMGSVLSLAAVYNLVWGAAVVLFPLVWFEFAGMVPPRYPQIWQCLGMVVGVYGVGYAIAARDPFRHWPIVLVGLLGKLFGPIGFVLAASSGTFPWAWGLIILTNDVVWWVPFAAILYGAWREGSDTAQAAEPLSWSRAMVEPRSHRGASLMELSRVQPTLVVFLRHSGCTFCRLVLHELSRQRAELDAANVQLAVVHMSDPMVATLWCEKYALGDVHRFSDPHCRLYRAFGLDRCNLRQMLGVRLWWRGFRTAIWQGFGVGWQDGDGFRMPGAFLLSEGRLLSEYRCKSPADVPDFMQFVQAAGVSTARHAARLRENETVRIGS